ncbi:MAG TPA: hypothetical protein IAC25_00665 [Candidatus Enterenecus stercoripullorum]|nr:hypothetical protein [Candidatus Enterenecus stercoripullorum]
MKAMMKKLEALLEVGGVRKDIVLLVLSGLSLLISVFDLLPHPFDAAWVAILLCGVPIILEAVIGLVTAFDITVDVLVSMALIASVFIGEDFAAGEVAFIMQLGTLLEELTVARARAGIEKLVHLTPQTARVLSGGGERIVPVGEVRIGDWLRLPHDPGRGTAGSDIAADAADIVLVDDEVRELPHLFALSRHMMTTIKLNLTFSMALNFLAIALAVPGILNPVVGALVHNAGSVVVIVHSALLLHWRRGGKGAPA